MADCTENRAKDRLCCDSRHRMDFLNSVQRQGIRFALYWSAVPGSKNNTVGLQVFVNIFQTETGLILSSVYVNIVLLRAYSSVG